MQQNSGRPFCRPHVHAARERTAQFPRQSLLGEAGQNAMRGNERIE
jgi:hypothetical protein